MNESAMASQEGNATIEDIWEKLKLDNQVRGRGKTGNFDRLWTQLASGQHTTTTTKAKKSVQAKSVPRDSLWHVNGTSPSSEARCTTTAISGGEEDKIASCGTENSGLSVTSVSNKTLAGRNADNVSSSSSEVACASLDLSSADAMLTSLRHDLNIVADTGTMRNASVPLAALDRVFLAVESAPVPSLTDASVGIAKPLLRTLAAEGAGIRVRERCMEILICMVEHAPDAAIEIQGYVLPTVLERLHRPDTASTANAGDSSRATNVDMKRWTYPREQSEDVRLLLANLCLGVIHGSGSAVLAYTVDIVDIIASLTLDQYHAVALVACELSVSLLGAASSSPSRSMSLKSISKSLVFWVSPLMAAKRSEVRVAAISAVTQCVLCEGHESILDISAWRDPNMVPIKAFYGDDYKVNYFGKLSTDRSPRVRLAFLQMMREWLLKLPEARNDHEYRLMPYVLSAIGDDTNTALSSSSTSSLGSGDGHVNIAKEALAVIAAFGAQWEEENEDEIKRMRQFTPELLEEIRFSSSTLSSSSMSLLPPFQYPFPFANRRSGYIPRLGYGCRMCVFSTFKRLQYPIVNELMSWQEEVYTGAAKLLRTCLILAEHRVEDSLQRILGAMVVATARHIGSGKGGRSSRNDENEGPKISEACMSMLDCAYLIGKHVSSPTIWLRFLLSTLEADMDADTSASLTTTSNVLGQEPAVLLLMSRCLRGVADQTENAPALLRQEQQHMDRAHSTCIIETIVDLLLSMRFCEDRLHRWAFTETACCVLEVVTSLLRHEDGANIGDKYTNSETSGKSPLGAMEAKLCLLHLVCDAFHDPSTNSGCSAPRPTEAAFTAFAESVHLGTSTAHPKTVSSITLMSRNRKAIMATLVPLRQSRNLTLDVRILRTVILSFANANVDDDVDRSSPRSPDEHGERNDDARAAANMVDDVRTLAPSLVQVLTRAMARAVDRGAKDAAAAAWAQTFRTCLDSFPSEDGSSTGGASD